MRIIRRHTHEVTALAFFSQNSTFLISSSSDKTIRIWDVFSGHEVHCFYLPTSILSMEVLCSKPFDQYGGSNIPLVAGDSVGNLYWLKLNKMDQYLSALDFSKLELRIGKILSIKRVPNSAKLYMEDVDLGTSRRQIVSALVEHIPNIDHLRNRFVVVTCNIKEITLQGQKSSGKLTGMELHDHARVVQLIDPPAGCTVGDLSLIHI